MENLYPHHITSSAPSLGSAAIIGWTSSSSEPRKARSPSFPCSQPASSASRPHKTKPDTGQTGSYRGDHQRAPAACQEFARMGDWLSQRIALRGRHTLHAHRPILAKSIHPL